MKLGIVVTEGDFKKEYIGMLDGQFSSLDIKKSRAYLSGYNKDGKWEIIYTRLDEEDFIPSQISPKQAYANMKKFVKFPEVKAPFSASPYNTYNEIYDGKRVYAYYYDMNSAYANVMANYRFPDTRFMEFQREVGDDEIGFDFEGELRFAGEYAQYVFPLTKDKPFERFARYYYNLKKNAKDNYERSKYKEQLNVPVGLLQRHNPFLRAYIVNMCSKIMTDIVEPLGDDWILSNTDSIISRVPLDLKIGNDIGEWKFKEGNIAVFKSCYQWEKEKPKYKGVPSGWFKEGFDILTDELPEQGNIYNFDYDKGDFVRYEEKAQ